MNPTNNRRNFIKNAAIGTIASISIPQIVSAAMATESIKKIAFAKNDIVLFQGDSITDAGRDKKSPDANTTAILGPGYPLLCASSVLLHNPDKNLQIYNRGVSGNKVFQMADRWEADCMALKPTVLSILIGVNDFWHTLTGGYTGTIETYTGDYKKLLDKTKQAFPGIKLIIGEPFAVTGVKAVDEKWYPTFDTFRQAARDIASQYGAAFIPYQSVFDKAQQLAPGGYWTKDGVHPSVAGEALMAQAWLEAVKG